MSPAGFEPTVPASDRSQTHAISSLLRANIRVRVILFRKSWNLFLAFEAQDHAPYQHKPTDKITITNIPLNIVLGGFV